MEDVVVASRVRLARNVEHLAFPAQMSSEQADDLVAAAADAFRVWGGDGLILEPRSLSVADANFVVERSMATRDLMQAERPTLIYWGADGQEGVMVNEEDHFRIQGLAPGMDLESAFTHAKDLEQHLRKSFRFAVSDRYGFLTSCPSNTGSGMRASLMLHLPALARAKVPLEKVKHTARRASLAVRGVHGEGSRALGFFYQISNQRTLGQSTSDQLQAVAEFGREVCAFEQRTRQNFQQVEALKNLLMDDLGRALEIVQAQPALTTAQALEALSILRLGALLQFTDSLGFACTPERLLGLCFQLQPGHLQAFAGREMSPEQRDIARAQTIRRQLGFPN